MLQSYNLYKMDAMCTWLAHMLVEQHPQQESERAVREEVVGGVVAGDVKSHGSSLAPKAVTHTASESTQIETRWRSSPAKATPC